MQVTLYTIVIEKRETNKIPPLTYDYIAIYILLVLPTILLTVT